MAHSVLPDHDLEPDLTEATDMAWYAQRRPLFTGGNRVSLLRGGVDMFPALLRDLDSAQHSVWLANYLLVPKGMPLQVLEALTRAAERGVTVKVVMDGLGSKEVPGAVWEGLRSRGVHLSLFRPIRGLWSLVFHSSNWRRMHLKLCVIDSQVAYVGGINLVDDHYDAQGGWASAPRLDYAVRLLGPCVTPVLHTVRAMWTRATLGHDWRDDLTEWVKEPDRARRLRLLWQQARLRLTPREQGLLRHGVVRREPMRCAFVLRDNLRQRRTIERATLKAIQKAQRRIDLVTPYFYPGRSLKRALKDAARRGVKVRLLLQGQWDYRLAALAARVLYDDLLLEGIEIHEYHVAWLHAKVLCVDEGWATVGSSNLDPLSLMVNVEGNVIVRDVDFVQTLSLRLARDFAQATPVAPPLRRDTSRLARWRRGAVAWMARTWLRLAGMNRHF